MTYERQRAALRSNNSSGLKGVTRAGAKWQASIRRNGRPQQGRLARLPLS